MRPQGWPRSAGPEVPKRQTNVKFQEVVYTDPIDQRLYDEPREKGEDRMKNNPLREEENNGHYEIKLSTIENKETTV